MPLQSRRAVLASAALVALASACSKPAPRNAPPPGYYGPQQPPPGYAPRPGAPPARPAPQAGFPWFNPFGFQLPQPAALTGIVRPVNVAALVANFSRSPCRSHEVSPGNWIGFDCSPPTVMQRALVYYPRFGFIDQKLPDKVDHRQTGLEGPVRNQASVGSCTAVSLATAMDHQLRKGKVQVPVSAIHIWSNYRVPMMARAGDSNLQKSITAEQSWPYDPAEACIMMERGGDDCGAAYGVQPGSYDRNPQLQAKKRSADSRGMFKLTGIERLQSNDPNQIAKIIAGGDILWVAFNMNMSAWRNSGHQPGHVIPDYTPRGGSGHAVVLSGYRKVGNSAQFLIHNSWGESWGDRGYAWISANMVAKELRYAYRVHVNGDRPGPLPPPGPGPAPQPASGGKNGCPAGQDKDVMLGRCVNACASGARPAGGLCPPPLFKPFPSAPAPKPGPAPAPASGGCSNGQGKDVMTGQCRPLCPNGRPAIGGLCLPHVR